MLRLEVENGSRADYSVLNDGALMMGTRLYVPKDEALKREILEEAHCQFMPCIQRSQAVEEGTWEPDEHMRTQYPYLFE
ncbi:hypothetical protein L3X38_026994 [Prunus dulcis]|uniref:Uncharacterized protein n=1 Tax=Prunus dulcis TaxID=3755 RepID=A0AAD4VNB3_PRUDU|nr:hypothetical protein L3X38_026994 [Prunus dulcis]